MNSISQRILPNGALTIRQGVRYGAAGCEVVYCVLPGTSLRAREHLAKSIAVQQIAYFKSEKQRAAAAEAEAARDFYARIVPRIKRLRASGETFAAIAARLNHDGETTRTGRLWSGPLVRGVLNEGRHLHAVPGR